MHWFSYGRVNTTAFGIGIAGGGTWTKPKPIMERISVPGRNGELVSFTGAYENVEVTYRCGIPKGMATKYDDFASALLANPGYCRLEDTYHPGYYRMAVLSSIGAPAMGPMFKTGEFDVTFNCKPQMFLKTGEKMITFTNYSATSYSYTNPTLFTAKPLIRAYGYGSFTIGDTTVTISAADSYTDLDCETENAYKDTSATNRNSYITLSGDHFPRLQPGKTSITFYANSITKLEIYPRWWQL